MLKNLQDFLSHLPARAQLVVAYSGGVDSHVLLHALSQFALTQSFSLRAVHLNHGLHPNAAQWQQHVQQICHTLNIPLTTHALAIKPKVGESLEAVARAHRYTYFAQRLQPQEILCTAHHQDDQLETVLLQLIRGAGPKGLAAMGWIEPFAQGYHARPLLACSREMILHYANDHALTWVEDTSNQNQKFDRNFLRNEVIPTLKQRFPAIATTVARSANHCASSQNVLENYLKDDLKNLGGDFPGTLSRSKLLNFDDETQCYLLRMWLMEKKFPMPSTTQLKQIQKQLTMKNDVKAIVTWQMISTRIYRDSLFAQPTGSYQPPEALELTWNTITPLTLPQNLGILTFTQTDAAFPKLTVRFRKKGDGFALKRQLQGLNIPPWNRWRIPLIYKNNELIAIPNHWGLEAIKFSSSLSCD